MKSLKDQTLFTIIYYFENWIKKEDILTIGNKFKELIKYSDDYSDKWCWKMIKYYINGK